jgi:hypothetical protein
MAERGLLSHLRGKLSNLALMRLVAHYRRSGCESRTILIEPCSRQSADGSRNPHECAPDGRQAERLEAAAASGSQSERRPVDESGRLILLTTKTKKLTTYADGPVEEGKDRKPKIAISTPQQPADESQTLLWAV